MKQSTINANDTFLLNTKFFLIVTVVLGNILMPLLSSNGEAKAIVMTIFTFHMPIFVFITGYFSKSFPKDPNRISVIIGIVLQYLVFQTIYSTLDYFYFNTESTVYSFWAPYWMLWFLFSHLCWKLLLLVFLKLNHSVIAAFMLGVLVGYMPFDGYWLSISRTFVFFPFFLLGYYYRKATLLQAAKKPILKWTALFTLLLVMVGFYTGKLHFSIDWLIGSQTYQEMNHGFWYAGLYRVAAYAFAVIASAAFLLLMSARRARTTVWGERTVYVFLMHGAVLKVLAEAGLYQTALHPLLLLALLVVIGLVLTLLLSSARVAAATDFLIHPNPRFLLVKVKRLWRIQ